MKIVDRVLRALRRRYRFDGTADTKNMIARLRHRGRLPIKFDRLEANERRWPLANLAGQLEWDDSYDYKSERSRRRP